MLPVPERRICKVLGQPRSTQRYQPHVADDAAALTAAVEGLAKQYGRYGYRRVTALLRTDGWRVNHKRVERICRREGLKVPARQKKRGRLWLNVGSCIRLRPEHRNHVWTNDLVHERTQDGKHDFVFDPAYPDDEAIPSDLINRMLEVGATVLGLEGLEYWRGHVGYYRSAGESVEEEVQDYVEWIRKKQAEVTV